jgi:hypothetical protein
MTRSKSRSAASPAAQRVEKARKALVPLFLDEFQIKSL